MTRRELRENAFQLLFRIEFHDEADYSDQIDLFFSDFEDISDADMKFITNRFKGISEKLDQIDSKINEAAIGWKTSRMNKMDITLLRLAVYEILFDEDIPRNVAVNECVELAKKYGTDNSPSFVNGVLSKIS